MYPGVWAAVDIQALEAGGGAAAWVGARLGKPRVAKAGPVTGGPAPGLRTGHCVLITSSFLTPK